MTRETKIGLLVGLAFIIVIGILLSDHLTSSTEPPQATLAVAGSNVRSAVTTPGARDNPPITRNVTPASVAPTETVPTPRDLAPHAQPVQPVQVAVGGPASLPPQPRGAAPEPVVQAPVVQSSGNDVATNDSGNTNARDDEAVISKAPLVGSNEQPTQSASNQSQTGSNTTDVAVALRDAAKQHGEELVTLGGSAQNGQGTAAHPANMKQYVAAEGDTLSKLAGRFFGSNTKANRDLIVAANPSLKADPNKILVGHSYNIPAATGTSVSAAVAAQSQTAAPTPAQPAAPAQAVITASTNDNWYTVKDGDSLWKISTEECGGPAAIPAIRDLNKDTIKGDNVVVNTKIRLPNRVATAN